MSFLITPGDRFEFNDEIESMSDEEVWFVFACYVPTLAFEITLTYGHA